MVILNPTRIIHGATAEEILGWQLPTTFEEESQMDTEVSWGWRKVWKVMDTKEDVNKKGGDNNGITRSEENSEKSKSNMS